MATIRDVAKLAGVSVSTVSLSINNPGRVGKKTLQRVQKAIMDVGYAADPVARSLASGRSHLIGFVVGNVADQFFGNIRRALEAYAVERDHFVLITDSASDLEREQTLIRHLVGLKVAGLAMSPAGLNQDYVDFIDGLKIPVVCFDQKIDGLNRDFVGSNNYAAAAMLTEHLLHLGHTRIGFISGPDSLYTARERYRGFIETMNSAGIEVDPSLVVNGQYTRISGYESAMKLLVKRNRPTAIIGSNNTVALSALQVIQELGLNCPDDVSLVMIDDLPWTSVITPRITMVVQDTKQLGEIVASRLLRRVTSEELANEPPQDFLLDPKFVPGNSCRKI